MKNNLIIKIAVGVAAVATLFSVVTLIRSIVINSSLVFPVIQVAGSAAIFAVCFWMLRYLSAPAEDEDAEEEQETEEKEENKEEQEETSEAIDDAGEKAEKAIDELYEKYHLSDFEE